MSNPWFRMYHEFEDDPKVQIMPEDMQRRLVMLFCRRCKDVTFHETHIAFHWRVSLEELAKTKALFLEMGFIDEDWNLLNWNKRQFVSDSSTDRVRKHRQAKKHDEMLPKQEEKPSETDVTPDVTPPEAEQKQIKKQIHKQPFARSVPPEELAGTLPLVDGTDYEISKSDIREWMSAYPGIVVRTELAAFKSWLNANPTRKKTPKGIRRAIVSWLSRAQDKSHGTQNGGIVNGKANGKIDRSVSAATDFINEIEDRHGTHRGELLPGGGGN
jgi:hypothetical protein